MTQSQYESHIYEKYYTFIRYAILGRVYHDLADEITSITFEKAIVAMRNGKFVDDDVRAWLARIAKNALTDHYRKKKRELPWYVDEYGRDMVFDSVITDTSDEEKEELIKTVTNAIRFLPPEQKFVATKFYIDGVSVKDITHELAISQNTVLGRLRYARINLRKLLNI